MLIKKIKSWYNGKMILIESDLPETIGGPGVIKDYELKFHWSARLTRLLIVFFGNNWRWIFTTAIAAFSAYLGAIKAFSCI
jgi:hypothetical protein